MKRTPPLPKRIREFKPSDCRNDRHESCRLSQNIYELQGVENERKLFGTERMVWSDGSEVEGWRFGDWEWDLFMLLQDAAPVNAIADRIGKHPDPFSARNFFEEPNAGGAKTNSKLYGLTENLRCRMLVGSALVGILKPGANYSTKTIFDCPYVRAYCKYALNWVLQKRSRSLTGKFATVACMGAEPFQLVCETLKLDDTQRDRLKQHRGSLVACGNLRISYLGHPARFGAPSSWGVSGGEAATAVWNRMLFESGITRFTPP